MALVFLIGGTGNQLFEYVSSDQGDVFSTLFLRKVTRNLLGWTNHEQIFRFENPGLAHHLFGVLLLLFDFILAKLLNISMFTEFDTRSLRLEPMLQKRVRLGYFQNAPERRSAVHLVNQLEPLPESCAVVLHIRGGDLLSSGNNAGQNGYGKSSGTYYRTGIKAAVAEMEAEGRRPNRILVLTDDPEYAATLELAITGLPVPEIKKYSLSETLARAIGAEWFVSSNSTLAYWIVQFREGERCVAPMPFQKRRDFELPLATRRISVAYN